MYGFELPRRERGIEQHIVVLEHTKTERAQRVIRVKRLTTR